MGLDQYLYATVNLPECFGLTDEAQKRFTRVGYLPFDDYGYGPNEEREAYRALLKQTGLEQAKAPNSPMLSVISDEDDQRDGFAVQAVVGYWRKANHIHAWFVREVCNDKDDCAPYPVSRDQLTELRNTCLEVLQAAQITEGKVSNGQLLTPSGWHELYVDGMVIEDTTVMEERLPTQPGFFFGPTGYDEGYIRDVCDTLDVIDRVLEHVPAEAKLTYRGDW